MAETKRRRDTFIQAEQAARVDAAEAHTGAPAQPLTGMQALRDAASRRLMELIEDGKATAGDLLKVLATQKEEEHESAPVDFVVVVDGDS